MAQTTTQCITITHILYDNGQRYIRYVDRKHFLTHFGHDHGRRIYCDDQPNTTRDIALLFFKSIFFLFFLFYIFVLSFLNCPTVFCVPTWSSMSYLTISCSFIAPYYFWIFFLFKVFFFTFLFTFLFPFINFFCVLFMWLSFPFNILSNIFSFSIHFGIICRRKIVLCT